MRAFVAITLSLLAMSGCGHEEESLYLVEYQIGMNSMEIAPLASPDQPLVVRLTGIIGPDGRYRFDRAVINETAATYELTLYGLRNDDPNAAFPAVVIEWQGREFLKQPPHADSVDIIFHQPDGSTLSETVVVRP